MEELNTPKKEFQRGFFWGIIVMLAVVAVILLFQNGKLRFQPNSPVSF